jgi:hypothetical protein
VTGPLYCKGIIFALDAIVPSASFAGFVLADGVTAELAALAALGFTAAALDFPAGDFATAAPSRGRAKTLLMKLSAGEEVEAGKMNLQIEKEDPMPGWLLV